MHLPPVAGEGGLTVSRAAVDCVIGAAGIDRGAPCITFAKLRLQDKSMGNNGCLWALYLLSDSCLHCTFFLYFFPIDS